MFECPCGTTKASHCPLLYQICVKNYWEALGVVAAHKAGVNPFSLRVNGVKHIKIAPELEDVKPQGLHFVSV